MDLYIVHVSRSAWIHLDPEIPTAEHGERESVAGQYLVGIEYGKRSLEFSSQVAAVAVFIPHDSDEMLYILERREVGDHDIIGVFKSEYVTGEFDAFPVMIRDTVDSEGLIPDADTFPSAEDIVRAASGDFRAFDDSIFSFLLSYDCGHLAVVKDDSVSDFHDFYYLWKADLEVSRRAETVLRVAAFIAHAEAVSYFHREPFYPWCDFMDTRFRPLEVDQDRHERGDGPQVFGKTLQILLFSEVRAIETVDADEVQELRILFDGFG